MGVSATRARARADRGSRRLVFFRAKIPGHAHKITKKDEVGCGFGACVAAGTVAAHLAETPPSWDMMSRL